MSKTPEEIAAEEAAQKAAYELEAAKNKAGDIEDKIAYDIDAQQEKEIIWLKQQLLDQQEQIKKLETGQPVLAEVQARQAEILESLASLQASILAQNKEPAEPPTPQDPGGGPLEAQKPATKSKKEKPKPAEKTTGRIIM